jgi:penicillin-binding protein 1A
VSLTKALSLSLNTVAVRLGLEVGPKTVVKTAHRLGIASDLEPNASIALGTSEVSPLELVAAYAAFANGGIGVQPHVISRVRTANGKQLYARKNASFGRVIDPQYVSMMNTMMQETLLTGTAHKAELPGWQAAGKTGTSQEWRDAWFVGYTSYLVAGVWLGNDDGTPTKKVSGGNLPVEIWSRFMKAAHQGVPVAALPSGVWRNADAPAPESPPPEAPPDPPAAIPQAAGPPMTINRGGVALQNSPPIKRDIAPVSAPDAPPLPPGTIPYVGGAGQPGAHDKSMLNKLFGGA